MRNGLILSGIGLSNTDLFMLLKGQLPSFLVTGIIFVLGCSTIIVAKEKIE